MRRRLATLPNLLTLCRLAILPLLAILLEKDMGLWACLTLTIAGISDVLDGYLARRYKEETDFGTLMDPIADKVLLCVAVIFLVADGNNHMSPWLATLLMARELLISGLRAFVASAGVVMPAGRIGKFKALLQNIGLGALMIGNELPPLPAYQIGQATLWASVILSYWSMVRYATKAYIELKRAR